MSFITVLELSVGAMFLRTRLSPLGLGLVCLRSKMIFCVIFRNFYLFKDVLSIFSFFLDFSFLIFLRVGFNNFYLFLVDPDFARITFWNLRRITFSPIFCLNLVFRSVFRIILQVGVTFRVYYFDLKNILKEVLLFLEISIILLYIHLWMFDNDLDSPYLPPGRWPMCIT